MAGQIIEPEKKKLFNPFSISNLFRIFSQKGLQTGISTSPQYPGIGILGTEATTSEDLKDAFGCCCRKSGDCILVISIIDECSISPSRMNDLYNSMRAIYPSRNFVVFQPDIWDRDPVSRYVIAQWNGTGEIDRGAGIYLPEKWGQSAGIDHIEKVVRDDGVESPDDWFAMLQNLGVISTDPNAGGPNEIVITPAFGKIAFFLDTSGSMVLRTVENSYHLFRQRLQDELGILADPAPDARLIERISGGEDWIGPHAVERPDEECVAEVPPGGGTGGAVTGQ